MAVNELERDYLAMLHECDVIEMIIAGQKMEDSDESEKKKSVGGIIMSLEKQILDDKYAKKDLTRNELTCVQGNNHPLLFSSELSTKNLFLLDETMFIYKKTKKSIHALITNIFLINFKFFLFPAITFFLEVIYL